MLGGDFFTFFFFNDTATTEIYTLSLHDALPISRRQRSTTAAPGRVSSAPSIRPTPRTRSEEHTSELQSQSNLVCRLLLEKKKTTYCGTAPWHSEIPSNTITSTPSSCRIRHSPAR